MFDLRRWIGGLLIFFSRVHSKLSAFTTKAKRRSLRFPSRSRTADTRQIKEKLGRRRNEMKRVGETGISDIVICIFVDIRCDRSSTRYVDSLSTSFAGERRKRFSGKRRHVRRERAEPIVPYNL